MRSQAQLQDIPPAGYCGYITFDEMSVQVILLLWFTCYRALEHVLLGIQLLSLKLIRKTRRENLNRVKYLKLSENEVYATPILSPRKISPHWNIHVYANLFYRMMSNLEEKGSLLKLSVWWILGNYTKIWRCYKQVITLQYVDFINCFYTYVIWLYTWSIFQAVLIYIRLYFSWQKLDKLDP